ncbi:MAG TPA: hypothetical protein VIL79_07340 [Thermoleophilia bacterium]
MSSQYSIEPRSHRESRTPYREWPIDEPTSRRVDLWIEAPKDVEYRATRHGESGRLTLIEDTYGDNCILVAMGSVAEYLSTMASPGVKLRTQHWNSTPRYGTWQHYLLDVALVRYIFEFAGWTATPEEGRLMDALDAYGQRAPERVCGRVREAIAA